MIKFLARIKSLLGGKVVHDKLDQVLVNVEDVVSMFTNTIEGLRRANDELSNISQECLDVIEKHQGTLNTAYDQVAKNKQLIENIENLVGKKN